MATEQTICHAKDFTTGELVKITGVYESSVLEKPIGYKIGETDKVSTPEEYEQWVERTRNK